MRRTVGATLAGVLLAFVLSQLLLPRLAASNLRDRLSRSGRVLSVEVSAFPAIQLLWHHANRVSVKMASYTSNPAGIGRLLGQAGEVGELSAAVRTLHSGLLTLTDVSLTKVGAELSGTARVSQSALRAAVPFLASVAIVRSGGGALTLEGRATLLGISATATVEPQAGRLVVIPNLPLVGGILSLTVFSAPGLTIQGVSASPVPGGLALSARARLD